MADAETWDLLDEQGAPTGEVHRRGDPRWPPGRFHLMVATCVVRSDGLVLLTRRAATKTFPFLWEIPGGSVLAGETGAQAAVREVREETGLVLDEGVLERVGRGVESASFLDVHVATVPGRPRLVLDPAEVHEATWVTWAEVEDRRAAGRMPAPWVGCFAPLWPDLARKVAEAAWRT
ncbi:NUDIX domain-containing protein [Oerskovia sp. KBS0722]|uniref:NUDIX domain-containing protein n=1 Tax=Oerskovia sp. KBS0722 TaxID=1179673 RepID=UPI00110EE883|nr:NUDIX hydrolase [Oerskovia sp. KBS0722]QDW61355.1 NUDIX hydrolase [Oerskovia sp. KBS0722]